jgi:hypothetical protein
MPCRAHLDEVQQRYEGIRQLGGEVLVVSFSPPNRVAAYVARYPLLFPVVADPTRTAYRRFELGRTSWWRMLAPGFVIRYLGLILRGRRPRPPDEEEDIWQLGGDFLLDGQRRLKYAYRSGDPADRPAAEELVQAVRAVV